MRGKVHMPGLGLAWLLSLFTSDKQWLNVLTVLGILTLQIHLGLGKLFMRKDGEKKGSLQVIIGGR